MAALVSGCVEELVDAGSEPLVEEDYTHGPDGGPWLFDDVLGEAWMRVSETDGRLDTHPLEDSAAPMAGAAAGWPAGLGRGRVHPCPRYPCPGKG